MYLPKNKRASHTIRPSVSVHAVTSYIYQVTEILAENQALNHVYYSPIDMIFCELTNLDCRFYNHLHSQIIQKSWQQCYAIL